MQERVTRQEMRDLHIGQTRIFTLTNPKRIASARVQAHALKNEEGLEFQVKCDYKASSISITRLK